jgi:hypothetical protein
MICHTFSVMKVAVHPLPYRGGFSDIEYLSSGSDHSINPRGVGQIESDSGIQGKLSAGHSGNGKIPEPFLEVKQVVDVVVLLEAINQVEPDVGCCNEMDIGSS